LVLGAWVALYSGDWERAESDFDRALGMTSLFNTPREIRIGKLYAQLTGAGQRSDPELWRRITATTAEILSDGRIGDTDLWAVAYAASRSGDAALADEAAARYLRRRPDDPEAGYFHGLARLRAGALQGALETFERVLRATGEHGRAEAARQDVLQRLETRRLARDPPKPAPVGSPSRSR